MGPIPATRDEHGANLDPRDCDCGKGRCCPLMTPAWERYLGESVLQSLDVVAECARSPFQGFAVVDLRDGTLFQADADGVPFLDVRDAERFARLRNDGLFVAFQSYRVVRLEQVMLAAVRPLPLGG